MKLMVWGEGSEESVCMANKMGLRPHILGTNVKMRFFISNMSSNHMGGTGLKKRADAEGRQLTCCQ